MDLNGSDDLVIVRNISGFTMVNVVNDEARSH